MHLCDLNPRRKEVTSVANTATPRSLSCVLNLVIYAEFGNICTRPTSLSKSGRQLGNPLPTLTFLVEPLSKPHHSKPMAPRSTRPISHSKAPATRKRGESDPNEPPKKCKTRHSKGEMDEVDESRDVADALPVKLGGGKASRRVKKVR